LLSSQAMSFRRSAHAALSLVAVLAAARAAPAQEPKPGDEIALKPWDEIALTVPIVKKATAYVPKQRVSSVFLFISGDGGWELGVVDMSRRIMPKAIVIGIAYPSLKTAQGVGPGCWQPAGALEEIAHAAERELDLPEYLPPILLGYSSGATAVYAGLAGAPPQTFSGGLSLGFCPDLPSLRPVCNGDGFKPTFDAKKNTAWLPRVPSVPKPWYVLNGIQDAVCLPPDMHKFLDGMGNVHFVEAPGTGHGFGRPGRLANLPGVQPPGAGLRLRPRDAAKIGQLVLNGGTWHGQRVVPEDWVKQSTKPRFNASWGGGMLQYGYQWWLGTSPFGAGRTVDWIAAFGGGGQRIFIVPTLDLVVVTNAGLYADGGQSAIVRTIFEYRVLPAIRDPVQQ